MGKFLRSQRIKKSGKSNIVASRGALIADAVSVLHFEFEAQIFARVLIGGLFVILSLPLGFWLMSLTPWLDTGNPYFNYAFCACALFTMLALFWLLLWSKLPESIDIDATGMSSRIHGRIEWSEVLSYRIAAVDFPPKIKIHLRNRKTIRIALRPHATDEVVDHYVQCIDRIMDGIDGVASNYMEAGSVSTQKIDVKATKSKEESSDGWFTFIVATCVVMLVVGVFLIPSRVGIAVPIVMTALGAAYSHRSWRAGRARRNAAKVSPQRHA